MQIAGACQRYAVPANRTHRKFAPDERIDEALIRAYEKLHRGDIGAVKATAQRLGLTYGWAKWRAMKLGCIRPKQGAFWSEEEDVILAEYAELGLKTVQNRLRAAGFNRSQSAILGRCERRRIHREHPELMTASAAADLLGLDNKTVGRWIRTDGLKATKRRLQTPEDEPGSPQNWAISRKNLAAWLRDHPGQWDVHRVRDHYWIVELLAGAPRREDS
jgi:hypothetical protein